MISRYLEIKTFELFRDRLIGLIEPLAPNNSKLDIYKHIFLAPSEVSSMRKFQISGVSSPYVCMWSTSALKYEPSFYSRSVLPQDYTYTDEKGTHSVRCRYMDYTINLEVFSSSYFKDFRDRVNQDFLDLQAQQGFIYNISELIPGATTKVVLSLEDLSTREVLDQRNGTRAFELKSSFTLKATVPYPFNFEYLEGLTLFLNKTQIYEKEVI